MLCGGNFKNIYIPNLEKITYGYNEGNNSAMLIYYNNTIETLSAESLEEITFIGGSTRGMIIWNSNSLEIINMPSLNIMNYMIGRFIGNCPNLKIIILGNVESQKDMFLDNLRKSLIHIEASSISCAFYATLWLPTNAFLTDSSDLVEDTSICSNNLEQFLYNFRECIIKRLVTQASTKYIYLHTTTKSYILGTDGSHYSSNWIVPGESDTYLNTLNDELTARNWGLA